jgi:hypothetical protein
MPRLKLFFPGRYIRIMMNGLQPLAGRTVRH